MNIPMTVLLLQGIPEGAAITTLAFVICGISLNRNKILLIGTALALCAYVVRLFPIPFGIHTIMVIFLLFVFLTMSSKRDIGLSFMASLLSCLALVIIETVCLALLMPAFSIAPTFLSTSQVVRIGLGEIQVVLLFMSAFLLKKNLHKMSYLNF